MEEAIHLMARCNEQREGKRTVSTEALRAPSLGLTLPQVPHLQWKQAFNTGPLRDTVDSNCGPLLKCHLLSERCPDQCLAPRCATSLACPCALLCFLSLLSISSVCVPPLRLMKTKPQEDGDLISLASPGPSVIYHCVPLRGHIIKLSDKNSFEGWQNEDFLQIFP